MESTLSYLVTKFKEKLWRLVHVEQQWHDIILSFIGMSLCPIFIWNERSRYHGTDEEMEAYREDLAEFQKPARARPNRTFQAVGPPEDEG